MKYGTHQCLLYLPIFVVVVFGVLMSWCPLKDGSIVVLEISAGADVRMAF